MDRVMVHALESKGTPRRCTFAWRKPSDGEWVRCLNTKGKAHGPTHNHIHAFVNVGEELFTDGMWIDE